MKKLITCLLGIVTTLLFFNSCLKEGNETLVLPNEVISKVNEQGLTREIVDLVPQDILDEMQQLGMILYGGENPPNIEGIYLLDSTTLLNSNISSDTPGKIYKDETITFRNQNGENLTIECLLSTNTSYGSGYGSYTVGEGNLFSVFVKVLNVHTDSNDSTFAVRVYSGEMEETGIRNLHFALFMLDDFGDPNGHFIDIGQGRVFYDGDYFSEKLSGLKKDKLSLELPNYENL